MNHGNIVGVALALTCAAAAGRPAAAQFTSLLCEWQPKPQAVRDPCPEFFWEAEGQRAYRLRVGTTAEAARSGKGALWDSGRVETTLGIAEYDGPPLANGTTYFWSVHVWSADGRSVTSRVATFRMKLTAPRYLRPHTGAFLNFGSPRRAELIANRYDYTFRREPKQHRPGITTINYALLATMVIPSAKAEALARFCVERGLGREGVDETMFLHLRDDCPITLHVGAETAKNLRERRVVPGWDPRNDRNGDGAVDDAEFADRLNPKASARRMKDARVPIYYWGPPRDDYVMNVGRREYQRFLAEVWAPSKAEGFDGLFIDTTTPDVPGPGRGGVLLEYPPDGPRQTLWLRDMQMMLAHVRIGLGGKCVLANGWQARPFVLDGTEWENWLSISNTASTLRSRIEAVADLDRRGKIQLIQYNPVFDPEAFEFGVKVDVPPERDRLYGLAAYYLACGRYTCFGFGKHPYRRSQDQWFGAVDVDVGKPLGPYQAKTIKGAEPPSGNLLANGGFEQGTDGWEIAGPIAPDEQVVFAGRRSVRIDETDSTSYAMNRQYVDLEPNTHYTVIGHVKTRNVTGDGAQLYAYEFQGAELGGIPVAVTGTTEWREVRFTFRTGPGRRGRINFRIMRGTGTAWFDEIRLVKGAYPQAVVFTRRFEKATVLVRPGGTNATIGMPPARVALDRPARPLRSDGSLGEAQTAVALRPGEAAIMMHGSTR